MATECFVYIQLPGTFAYVPCGRFAQQRTPQGTVGRFVYGRSYRARPDAVALDPVRLPLSAQTYETAALGGIFGALRDASPDGWGRQVIERGWQGPPLTEVDYLLHSPDDRTGALSFGVTATPPAPAVRFNPIVQLDALRAAAEELEQGGAGDPLPDATRHLLQPGTSMGGARPKNVVEDDAGLWLAKFPSRGDRWDNGAVEAGMLTLARACGVTVPDHRVERLGGRTVLLLRRFDRALEAAPGGTRRYARARMASALTVVDGDDGVTDRARWSYLSFAEEMQRWLGDRAAVRANQAELFRRMAFNALTSNNDDHPRNHALVAVDRDWRLSPAYDLTPNPGVSHERDLAMTCGRFGRRASRANLLSGAATFGLREPEATALVDQVQRVVRAEWEGAIAAHGGSAADRQAVASAFDPPGFW